MLDERFIFVGVAISFLGNLSYFFAILRGRVKPNRVTWFIWALAPLIAGVAQLQQGVGMAVLATFVVGLNPLLNFFASLLNKKAYWKLGTLDLVCGALALFGIVLWQLTKTPNVAILFSIVADLLAGIPTLVKAYKAPETESEWTFLFGILNAVLVMLTFQQWTFRYYAFPLYIFLMCATLFILIHYRFVQRLTRF